MNIIIKTISRTILPGDRYGLTLFSAPRSRQQALSALGAAHPHPQAVTDPLFRDSAFFDPNDLVQVKYEMLRSIHLGTHRVVETAEAFGFSRPVYYVTQTVFVRGGLPGLLPHKRGPKQPHKLTEEVLAVLATAVREQERMPGGDELAALLAHRCGIHAHPRSIIRRLIPYLQRGGKKAPITAPAATLDVTQYAAQ